MACPTSAILGKLGKSDIPGFSFSELVWDFLETKFAIFLGVLVTLTLSKQLAVLLALVVNEKCTELAFLTCITSTPTVVKSIRASLVKITLMTDGNFEQYGAFVIKGENHLGSTMKDFIAKKLTKAIGTTTYASNIRKTAYLREGNL